MTVCSPFAKPSVGQANTVYTGLGAASIDDSRHILDYNRFLGSDSRVPDHLKRAIQIVEKHDTLPSCGKMAVSALMYSCATLEGKPSAEDGLQEQTLPRDVDLKGEKVLYATRLAVCELSESKAYIPRECKSFVPTKENTKKTGFLSFITENGPSKPIVSYPKYEEATNQDLDICLGALQNSAQTWTSYSNARQDAVNLCHAVRGDIEKDETLHLHKILTENTASNAEALRLMHENAQETREAFHHLVVNMRKFSVDIHEGNVEAQAKFTQMWNDVEQKVRVGMQDLANQVDQIKSKMSDSNIQVRESAQHVHGIISEIVTRFNSLMQQHRTSLALASRDAENAHEHLEFVNEILQQQVLQALSVALNKVQSVDALSGNALQNVQMIKNETENANEQVVALVLRLVDTLGMVQQLADGHEDIRASVNETRDSIASLKTDVLAISGYVSTVVGTVVGAFGHLPTVALYSFYLAVAGTILFFITLLPGGSLLLRSCARLVRYSLAKTGNWSHAPMRLDLSALSVVANYALSFAILSVVLATAYQLEAVRQVVSDTMQQLSEDGETAYYIGSAACGTIAMLVLIAILARVYYFHHSNSNAKHDKQYFEELSKLKHKRFWFNDPKKFQNRKWTV